MKTGIFYILTSEVNDYNQHGEYFVSVYDHKPTKEELIKTLEFEDLMNEDEHVLAAKHCSDIINNLINNGGGRLGVESEWYHLRRVKEGQKFD